MITQQKPFSNPFVDSGGVVSSQAEMSNSQIYRVPSVSSRDGACSGSGRKKVQRACSNCQKSHTVCEISRPCRRCSRKGLDCVEGSFKKAKYLMDIDEPSINNQSGSKVSEEAPTITSPLEFDLYKSTPCDQEVVNSSASSTSSGRRPNSGSSGSGSSLKDYSVSAVSTPLTQLSTPPDLLTPSIYANSGFSDLAGLGFELGDFDNLLVQSNNSNSEKGNNSELLNKNSFDSQINNLVACLPNSNSSVKDVYEKVTVPYKYAQNFNNLLVHIAKRLSKENIFRVCKAISHFRPALIAFFKNLTEQDLLYKERCCQRMILEYAKISSDSGTPCCIWRRTGEIVHVGNEFSYLTQWTKEMLFSRTSYIYELMDEDSLVSYWENYASVSFNNSQQSCCMNCNLITADGTIIKCALCFTIKRCMFDIPILIVGSFLPILC